MTIAEKYRKVLEIKKLSINKSELILGFGRNTLTNAIRDNRLLTPRYHRDFIEKFHVSENWWETGKGEVFNEKHTQVEESPLKWEAIPTEPEVVAVRVVEAKAQAGYLRGYADPEYMELLPKIYVSKEFERGGNYLAFTVSGDSMDDGTRRSLCHGDIVVGKELMHHHWANKLHFTQYLFIIVHPNEGIVFKQITAHNLLTGEITCHSFNNQYEDFVLNLKDVKQLFYIKKIVERNINF